MKRVVAALLVGLFAAIAAVLQGIEVRAFGVLLEELLERGDTSLPALQALARACLQEQPLRRPRFGQLEQALATMLPG